jgi:hypothetical protein
VSTRVNDRTIVAAFKGASKSPSGSLASVSTRSPNVCLSPNSGTKADIAGGRRRAISRLMQRGKLSDYSITSSERSNIEGWTQVAISRVVPQLSLTAAPGHAFQAFRVLERAERESAYFACMMDEVAKDAGRANRFSLVDSSQRKTLPWFSSAGSSRLAAALSPLRRRLRAKPGPACRLRRRRRRSSWRPPTCTNLMTARRLSR